MSLNVMGCHGMSWDVMVDHLSRQEGEGPRPQRKGPWRPWRPRRPRRAAGPRPRPGSGGSGRSRPGSRRSEEKAREKRWKPAKWKTSKYQSKNLKIIKMIKKTPQDQIRKRKYGGFDEVTPWWQVRQVSVVALAQRGSHGYRSILSKTPLLREPPASPPKVAKPATNWREEADEAKHGRNDQTNISNMVTHCGFAPRMLWKRLKPLGSTLFCRKMLPKRCLHWEIQMSQCLSRVHLWTSFSFHTLFGPKSKFLQFVYTPPS